MAEKELKPWADRYVALTNRQLHRLLSDVEMGIAPEGSALERAVHLKLVDINDKQEMSLTFDGKKLLDKLRPPFLQRHGYVYRRAQLSDTALLKKLYEDEYYAYELGLSTEVSPAKIERAKKRGLHFQVTDTIWETGPPELWREYNPKANVRSADWLSKQEALLYELYDTEIALRKFRLEGRDELLLKALEMEAEELYEGLVGPGWQEEALDVIQEAADPSFYDMPRMAAEQLNEIVTRDMER
jgi:hypothetical protein